MSRPRDVASALRAYVRGRDRVWEHGRKLGRSGTPSGDPPADSPPEVAFGQLPEEPKFGVSVAEELDFRRGPAAWRDSPAQGES
ncbi:hypothetical protein [Candidatus Palauibacter sp.]|uniref:hypothetical protein n=1 Tax=Candidatus Palauibacter sp. TaxID=3101350 RepID=UPI003B528E51